MCSNALVLTTAGLTSFGISELCENSDKESEIVQKLNYGWKQLRSVRRKWAAGLSAKRQGWRELTSLAEYKVRVRNVTFC